MASKAKRQKTRIEDIRREELIDAAHRIFLQEGLRGLTTTRICAEAGMSQGILTYYFKDKDEVLFEMVRRANGRLMDEVVVNLRQAATRWDRLAAIIDGNFPAREFHQNVANAWISFYAEAAHNPRYAQLQRLFYRRLRSNIGSALSPLWPSDRIDHFVRGFAGMLDGFWLRRGHSEADISLAEAKLLLTEYAEKMLGEEMVRALKAAKPDAVQALGKAV
jgi:TetR/AcrR family transcriptional regulator, transcriptional repressor of bet genes